MKKVIETVETTRIVVVETKNIALAVLIPSDHDLTMHETLSAMENKVAQFAGYKLTSGPMHERYWRDVHGEKLIVQHHITRKTNKHLFIEENMQERFQAILLKYLDTRLTATLAEHVGIEYKAPIPESVMYEGVAYPVQQGARGGYYLDVYKKCTKHEDHRIEGRMLLMKDDKHGLINHIFKPKDKDARPIKKHSPFWECGACARGEEAVKETIKKEVLQPAGKKLKKTIGLTHKQHVQLLEAQITNLEVHSTHQEDTIDHQQMIIEQLQEDLQAIGQQLAEARTGVVTNVYTAQDLLKDMESDLFFAANNGDINNNDMGVIFRHYASIKELVAAAEAKK